MSVKTHYFHVLTIGGMFPDIYIKTLGKIKKKNQNQKQQYETQFGSWAKSHFDIFLFSLKFLLV